jgi:hypothetical protein
VVENLYADADVAGTQSSLIFDLRGAAPIYPSSPAPALAASAMRYRFPRQSALADAMT